MMKKTLLNKRGHPDGGQAAGQPEKCGWIRKYCGKGIFREIWKNRFVILKTNHLYISEKEVKDEQSVLDRFDLTDYEKCEELRKSKSRSKKNHSKFTLVRNRQPGNTVPNLVFLAMSPEEKESWINVLTTALSRAKNRVFDEVTVDEESFLAHPTRDRVKIQHSRRPPTRGHLMAVASTSTPDGMLTLDLIQEEEAALDHHGTCAESFCTNQIAGSHPKLNSESCTKTAGPGETEKERSSRNGSLPKRRDGQQGESASSLDREGSSSPHVPKKPPFAALNKCASEEILSRAGSAHGSASRKGSESQSRSVERERLRQVKELVALKLERTRQMLLLLEEGGPAGRKGQSRDAPGKAEGQSSLCRTEQLLAEALTNWHQAKQVLEEIEQLRDLCKGSAGTHVEPALISCSQPPCRRSLM